MDAEADPAPGWYPDPHYPANGMRYWDGLTWTGHCSAVSSAPSAPEPPPPSLALSKAGLSLALVSFVFSAVGALMPHDVPLTPATTGNVQVILAMAVSVTAFMLATGAVLLSWFGYREFRNVDPRPRLTRAALIFSIVAVIPPISLPL